MNLEDEELCKRLQELLENPQAVKDDPYFASDKNLFSTTLTTPVLKDISDITLTLPTHQHGLLADGPVRVGIRARRGSPVREKRFTCFIYTEEYFPMCNSEMAGVTSRTGGNCFNIDIACSRIWLPGRYILLVRDTTDSALERISFTLDDQLMATLGNHEVCDAGSLDDILTSCLENSESAWDTIATTPGTAQLRQYCLRNRQLRVYNEIRKALDAKELKCDQNLLIRTINKDWDEHVLQMFQKLSVWGAYFTYIDCSTLYNAALSNPYEELNDKLCNTTSQVFCLTNVSTMLTTGGKVIVKRFIEKMKEDTKYRLWLVGSRQEIDSLLEMHPSLKELFLRDNHLEQQSYSAFELVQRFFTELHEEGLTPTADTKDTLVRTFLRLHSQGSLSAWTLATIRRFVAEDIRPNYTNRVLKDMHDQDELPDLTLDDINLNRLPQSASAFEESIAELNGMVGLDTIKHSITTMANQTRFFIERQKQGLPTSFSTAHHALFTGNPGTGKTTVAKMLGKIYHAIGLLSKGDVICADRTRLVGRFIGETEENMKAVLEEARGNVLFIDEAYNLYEGTADRKDYGNKVIDSLLTVLAQPDPDMVIIFAGYEKELDAMLNSNPGLMGRFPYKYRFSDYSAEQLMEIACHLFERDKYILTDEARTLLRDYIGDTLAHPTKNFSNARWVEQFVRNGIIPALADRIMASGSNDYQHVLPADVKSGYQKFNPRMIELKPRQKVGFSA